jgi:gas vesicle protein
MKQKLTLWLLPVVCFVLLFSGCEDKLSPIEVSRLFWKGVELRDTTIIKKFISSDSQVNTSSTENILPVRDATFGRTVIEGDMAWVDTTVTIASEEPFTLPLTTTLVKENGYWKVNYNETIASVSSGSDIARIMGSIQDLSGKFADELDRSIGEMQKAIPEIKREIEQVEEKIKSRIPELKRRMEEFTRQLEEILKLPPQPSQDQKEAIEI